MIRLNVSLKNRFRVKLNSYHQSLRPFTKDEEDFIDRTVKAFSNYQDSHKGQSIRARSTKIHRKPIACFPPCTPVFSSKKICREIGDLLFVYKHFSRGSLDAHRATLIQAKHTRGMKKVWSIETGQFCLLTSWPIFNISAKPGTLYNLKPKALTWSSYGLVGPRAIGYPVYFSSARIMRTHRRSASTTKHFSFALKSDPMPWDYGGGFLSRFVHALVGENLFYNSGIKDFIDDLYKMAEWIPDPPGEFEWKEEEKQGSIGIIEFIISEEGG